jgi:hypothetical protein
MTEKRTFLQRLFGGGEKPSTQPSAPPPAPSAPASTEPLPTLWHSLGVLFDIDALGRTDEERMFYGRQARVIFMKHFRSCYVGRCYLWHGDTQSTLDGAQARRFCIAVTTMFPSELQRVRTTYDMANDTGLAPRRQRFLENPVDLDFATDEPKIIRREPLPLWFSVDDTSTVVLPAAEAEDIELMERFGWFYRVG